MSKNKRIIIALIISLILLLVFNIVYYKYIKADDVQAYMLVEDVIKGEKLSLEKLKKVNISNRMDEFELVTKIEDTMYAAATLKKRSIACNTKYNSKA